MSKYETTSTSMEKGPGGVLKTTLKKARAATLLAGKMCHSNVVLKKWKKLVQTKGFGGLEAAGKKEKKGRHPGLVVTP